jgi:hypothetical protein
LLAWDQRWPWTFTLSGFGGALVGASGTYAASLGALGRRRSRHGSHRPTRAPTYSLVHPAAADPALSDRVLKAGVRNITERSSSDSGSSGIGGGSSNSISAGLGGEPFNYCLAWEQGSGQWRLWRSPRNNATNLAPGDIALACTANALQGAETVRRLAPPSAALFAMPVGRETAGIIMFFLN